MLNANPRQFFNFKMKGRRARIRNQKRSRHYRSWLDRSLDKVDLAEQQKKQKRIDSVNRPKRSLYYTEGQAEADKKSSNVLFAIVVFVVIIGLVLNMM